MELNKAPESALGLRIKYESFAKLTTEISTAQSVQTVTAVLQTNLKYHFDFTHFRLLVFYKKHQLLMHITRQSSACFEVIDNIYPVEQESISRNLPLVYTLSDFHKDPTRYHPQTDSEGLQQFCLFPIRSDEEQYMLICAAGKEDIVRDADYKFLRLMGEFLLSKLSQIILTDQLEGIVNKRTEQLNRANHELSTLFYRASHDLGSPITSLLGLVELGRKQNLDKNEIQLIFNHMSQVIHGAQTMLGKLRSISEAETLMKQVSVFSINGFLEDLTLRHTRMANIENVKITFQATGIESVSFQKELLNTLLDNLIENAIRFHSVIPNRFVHIAVSASLTSLVCTVEDNGEGIPAKKQENIFDMYARHSENSKGTGLGLYLVKKITEGLHGTVSVSSAITKGSTFTLQFPL